MIFDQIPIIYSNKGIDSESATSLIRTRFDELVYYTLLGRGVNYRIKDQSCVLDARKGLKYLSRTLSLRTPSDQSIFDASADRLLPVIVHMSTFNNTIFEDAFGSRALMCYVIRNPLLCLEQWISYIHRIGRDPREFTPYSETKEGILPWYIDEYVDEYMHGSETDQALISVYCLLNTLNKKVAHSNQPSFFLVSFENLVKKPELYLSLLSRRLGHSTFNKRVFRYICKKNGVPRLSDGLKSGYWKQYSVGVSYSKDSVRSDLGALRFHTSQNISTTSLKLLDEALNIYDNLKRYEAV